MVRRNEVLEVFKQTLGCREIIQVDDTSEEFARHICLGGKEVFLLPKQFMDLPTYDETGFIRMEYYACYSCGKVILNRNFM